MPEARRDTLRRSATAQTLGNVLEMHGAGLTACLQSSRMTGEGAGVISAQHGTTEHSSVAALSCTTVGQGLSWHTMLVCMAVVYGGGAGAELLRTPTRCSSARQDLNIS